MKISLIVFLLFLGVSRQGLSALDDYDYGGGSRMNGPPSYRTYDRTSAYQSKTYSSSDYQPSDANEYWGERYYGGQEEEPSLQESYELEKGILDLEQKGN